MSQLELAREIVRLELELEFDPRKQRIADLIRAYGVLWESARRVVLYTRDCQVKLHKDATDEEIGHHLANQRPYRTKSLEENLADFDRTRAIDRRGMDPRGGPLKWDDMTRDQVTGDDPEWARSLNERQQIQAVFLHAELERRQRSRH